MTTTVAAAVAALRERLDEPTAAQWTDVSLRRWLNEGIRDLARRTRIFTDTDTISVTANTGTYTAASDILHIRHVYFTPDGDTRMIPLEARAWEGMDNVWGTQQNATGAYPVLYSVYGYAPTLSIKLFPTPSVDGDLTLHVARLPAALDVTSGTGNIDVPEAWLEAAYDYAEYMALRKDRDPRWQEVYALYEAKVLQINEIGDTINAPGEFVMAPGGAMVPSWLAGYGDW